MTNCVALKQNEVGTIAKRAMFKNRMQMIPNEAQTISACSVRNRGNLGEVFVSFRKCLVKLSAVPVCLSESCLSRDVTRTLRHLCSKKRLGLPSSVLVRFLGTAIPLYISCYFRLALSGWFINQAQCAGPFAVFNLMCEAKQRGCSVHVWQRNDF